MVMFFKPQKQSVDRYFDLTIESLDGHCIGVGKKNDRTWFVPNTMIGDEVRVEKKETSQKTGTATVQKYHKKSELRCSEQCCHADKCGGCSCQFIPQEKQIRAKIEGLKQIFSKNVNIKLSEPDDIVTKSPYHYRRTCRLSTYFDSKNGELHLGFRQKNSHAIVDITECSVLKECMSDLLVPVRRFLNSLSIKYSIGHIELTAVDNGIFMLIRFAQKNPSPEDLDKYRMFCESNQINGYFQTDETFEKVYGADHAEYSVNGIKYEFLPNDFIQINEEINKEIINHAIEYLNPQPTDKILDLFCGIGNFSLQLATKAQQVCGVEIVKEMVEQAEKNAKLNALQNVNFVRYDLSQNLNSCQTLFEKYESILLDPGRKGANEISSFLAKSKIKNILYISCNPITATRDFKILCQGGFMIKKWAIFDMFSNTEHVETVVLLSRDKA